MKSEKRNRIIYWITTLWLALGMTSTGIVQLIRMEEEIERTVEHMGFPDYFLIIIGIWKLLGVVAILIPRYPVLKEWAYAGFSFLMSGAILSHFAVGDGAVEFFGPSLLLVLTIVSWLYRPSTRKISIKHYENRT